jgi:AcrR family transcriptional regulator
MPPRRERYREETRAEIRSIALRQIEESGPDGLSLNAIGREMGMSGPAIYRYYASRDELLTEVIVDGWRALADALEEVAAAASRRSAPARLRALAEAYRDWALRNPHRYGLMLGGRRPVGFDEPEEAIAPSQRSMSLILDALSDLAGANAPAPARSLSRQLSDWGRSRDPERERGPAVLRLGLATWTRLHGVVSLELAGIFDALGVDAALVLAAEVDDLIEAATG